MSHSQHFFYRHKMRHKYVFHCRHSHFSQALPLVGKQKRQSLLVGHRALILQLQSKYIIRQNGTHIPYCDMYILMANAVQCPVT